MASEDPVNADGRRFLVFCIRQLHRFISLFGLVQIEVDLPIGDDDPDCTARFQEAMEFLQVFEAFFERYMLKAVLCVNPFQRVRR